MLGAKCSVLGAVVLGSALSARNYHLDAVMSTQVLPRTTGLLKVQAGGSWRGPCSTRRMVTSHRELRAWQSADAIRRQIIALCATARVKPKSVAPLETHETPAKSASR